MEVKKRSSWGKIIAFSVVVGIIFLLSYQAIKKPLAYKLLPDVAIEDKANNDGSDNTLGSNYTVDDDIISAIVPVSPEKGYATGLKDYPLLTWNNNRLLEKEERTTINVEYPHFIGGSNVTNLNKYIDDYVQNTIQDDRNKLRDIVNDYPDSFESTLDLSIRYHLIGVVNGVVSIEIVTTDFTGGGNGNHNRPIIINWDLKTDALLKTSQLFCSKDYLSVIKPLVRERLLLNAKNSPNVDFAVAKSEIEDRTNDPSNFEDNITLYKDGIIVIFPPYSILSGVFGIIKVYVPDLGNKHFLCVQ
ncbi:MAG: DUF3298 domain-containing protein [bacterium]|nr:DUF3298 domain-containing protein [bacterium]